MTTNRETHSYKTLFTFNFLKNRLSSLTFKDSECQINCHHHDGGIPNDLHNVYDVQLIRD